MSLTYNGLFAKELLDRLREERQRIEENLGAGVAEGFDVYKELVGYIRALRDVGEWCAEIERDINEG